MAYIGLQPQQSTVATSTQQLSGNASDLEFTLNRAVSKAADILVFVGSTAKIPEVDYTAQNNTLLFTSAPASGTNNINISYKAGALTTINLSSNSFPVGTTVNPSIRAADAPSTGIYWPSTTTLGLTVSGNTRLTVTDSPTATSTTTGAVRVNGGVGISQAVHVGGTIHATGTTQSTNTTTGALIVSGGVGVTKDIFVGGSLDVAGAFTVAGAFNTTSSDSLIIDTPFVFLANNNLGDSLDTGFTSTYNDGTQRYTGLFRDITDGDYKLFDNLTVQPTTVVDTANVSFSYANLIVGNITATNVFGTIAGGTSITTVGNLANLSVQTTISSYGINFVYSTISSTSTTTGALQVKGGVGVVGNVYAGAVVSATNLTGTLTTAAQTAITSVGTLTALAVSGAITVNSGNNATAIINGGTNGTGNVGASGQGFNTVFAKSTSAQYADLAENYQADAEYAPGTVLHFGGEFEVSQCDADMCSRVAGVVSTAPAHLMNTGLAGDNVVALALTGRVPCLVQGNVRKGDMMVSAGNGRARAEANPRVGSVIGKALENFDGPEGIIEVVVGRV